MGAYLIDHPPVRDQFYKTRNRPLTGCTVLHTAESVMDTVGPDTGAESVAEFIRTRTSAGSYHDLADSDSWLRVVPLESGAYHDGTGSNNWALSLSFACGTHHWRQMSPERRAGFLRQGALAFADQQAWRRAHGHPLTELRRITKAQSDAGVSGFIYHGDRDPGRRTDPGKTPPNDFPFDEFISHCRAALAGTPIEEDDVLTDTQAAQLAAVEKMGQLLLRQHGLHYQLGGKDHGKVTIPGWAQLGGRTLVDAIAFVMKTDDQPVDTEQVAEAIAASVAEKLDGQTAATKEDVADAVRSVFADAATR